MGYKGNPQRVEKLKVAGKSPTGADASYINHKNYRGLLMRNQANDIGDLIDRFEEMYPGAQISRGNPAVAEFSTGAKVIFGHFGDGGWAKYIGQQYQRIGIDQAEMIPTKEVYDRIMGSCRSKWHDLIPQMMLTANPGGGDELNGAPGQGWLTEYFYIQDYLSGKFPKGCDLRDEHGKRRIFIPSSWKDNPYLAHHFEMHPEGSEDEGKVAVYMPGEGSYVKWLNSIEPESLRSAWRDGDWNALSGKYFKDFRPHGPLVGEPENARHVYDPSTVRLESWFHRWVSIDWGYIHPTDIQWHSKAPWGQVYTYKEISINRLEPVELGVLLARESKLDIHGLEAHHMNVFLSPDAYAKRESENTVASQIAMGINRELGPGAAFVSDLTETERLMQDSEIALRSMQVRRREQSQTKLTLVRANTDRVAGWMHLQTMLRFRPLQKEILPDSAFADRLYQEKGLAVYLQYMNQPEFTATKEVLPKWQISSECRELIRALPMMMHRPGTNDLEKVNATETRAGDDSADCFIAGTMIRTDQGETPIENIAIGDRVWTRSGLRTVRSAGKTRIKPLVTAIMSNGMTITGSGEHPIWIYGHGWKWLDSLRYGDKLLSWQMWSSLTGSSSDVTRSHQEGIFRSTTGRQGIIGIGALGRSMRKFTKLITDQFLRVITFTTKTAIRSTTPPVIWWLSPQGIMQFSTDMTILPISHIWNESAHSRGCGTGPSRVSNGIDSTARLHSQKPTHLRKWFAGNAAATSYLKCEASQNSALPPVSREREGSLGLTWSQNLASFAAKILSRISQKISRVVPVHVECVIPGGTAVTYNLAVDDVPEYFANGILVHNCARYGLLSEERQGERLAPLEVRVQQRVDSFAKDMQGLSSQSLDHMHRIARLKEEGTSLDSGPVGRNRLAVRRAFLATKHGERRERTIL